ncbi:hypothetical protein [Streptomyces sp. URMC 129]|uniref:hypothetical protein n=1 Tax=Streptomyces sp. URMC 129 TaxID=3423407 RepID=UPI003F1B291C
MTPDRVGVWAGAVLGLAGVSTLLWRAGRGLARLIARVDEVVDDWRGSPERPGVPARPGVLERIAGIEERMCQLLDRVARVESQAAAIEHELHPNGGSSLRDAVNRVDARTARVDARTAQIASDVSPDTE